MQNVSGGLYYDFGISDGIKNQLSRAGFDGCIGMLSFQLNIDSVPLFKSYNGQF